VDLLPILLAAALLLVVLGFGLLLRRPPRPTGVDAPLRFTLHAAERMAERGVRDVDVRATVADPDRIIATTYLDRRVSAGEQGERDSVRLEKDLPGRTLKVWVPPDWRAQQPVAVKSVAWQYSVEFGIPRSRAGRIIGRGGETIRELEQTYGVKITVEGRLGLARILGDDEDSLTRAQRHIERLVR
jgi:hypothetical protein